MPRNAERAAVVSCLVVEPRDGQGFTIRCGNRHYSALLSADVLEACRASAQTELEQLTVDLMDKLASDDLRSHLGWLFTPDYRRPDDLQGLFGWLFLFAVAERLVETGCPRRAELAEQVPEWVDQRLEQAGLEICRRPSSVRSRFRQIRAFHTTWQATRFLAAHAWLCLWRTGTAEPLNDGEDRSVLVKMPIFGAATRYGPLEPVLADAGWQVVPENFDLEPDRDLAQGWFRLLAWISIGSVLAALGDANRLNRRLARLAAGHMDTGLARSPAFQPSVFALARRMLQFRLWNVALESGRPRAAVLVTSLTRPEDRMLIACLKRHRVPVCLVLPRPVNPDRPAEKLLEIDRAHPNTLPDFFIARDSQSRDELTAQGTDPERIAVGLPVPSIIADTKPKETDCRVRLLILLTVLESTNTELCRMIADALIEVADLDVIVRCHPSVPLNDSARAALDRLGCGWQEHSGSTMAEQANEGTIAVTATSTAVIEAARHGAAVVWAPFLSEIALFQQRFMTQVGQITESECDLASQLQNLTTDTQARKRLATECTYAAGKHFSANRSIADVVLEWLEGLEGQGIGNKEQNMQNCKRPNNE